MSLQVRPGYVNPLTMMRKNKSLEGQNEMLLIQSFGSDSTGNTSEKVLRSQRKTVERASLQCKEVSSAMHLNPDVDSYEKTEKESDFSGIYGLEFDKENNYRERLGDKNQSESYEGMVNQINQQLQQRPKIVKCDLSYISDISEKMQSVGGGRTTVEKASGLLKAYAILYDEIMQEKNGDNEDYISGQIKALDDALKYHADYLENMGRLAPEYASSLEKYANTLSRWAKKLKNSVCFSLYYGTHVKTTRLERLMNREFNGSFQLVL